MKYGSKTSGGRAVATLAALAHRHRLRIYRLLVEAGPGGLSAGSIGARLGLPPSSLTFHLQHLHRAGLVTQERASRQLIYAADFSIMNGLVGYLTENCCGGSANCRLTQPSARTTRRRANQARIA